MASIWVRRLSVLLLSALLAACDRSPTTPSAANQPQAPNQPQSLVARLELGGPASIPPGETAQLKATAFYPDGSTSDVSARSAWSTAHPSVLSISTTGLATGRDAGQAFVEVSFGGKTATMYVFVLPVGTFALSGFIEDAGVRVPGARVDVTAGPASGLATTVDTLGFYVLYGVSGETEIRVTKPGYVEQRKTLQVAFHQSLDFDMALSAPRENLDGRYTLTITAAPECRSTLPGELLERRYSLVLSQNGPSVRATLEGAKFYKSDTEIYNTFRGVVEPDRLRFDLESAGSFYDWDHGWKYFPAFPSVLEELAGSTYLWAGGSIVLTGSGDRHSGTLNGVIATTNGPPEFFAVNSCASTGHRVEIVR